MDDLDALLADLQNSTSVGHKKNFVGYPNAGPAVGSHRGQVLNSKPIMSEYDLERSINDSPPRNLQHASYQGSTLSTNLSELDNLLQELSSAQFTVEVDRRSSGNMSGVMNASPSNHGLTSNSTKHSSAAYELDELMASLSCMTTNNATTKDGTPQREVLYSSPRSSIRSNFTEEDVPQHYMGGVQHQMGGVQHHMGGVQHHVGGVQHQMGGVQHHVGGVQYHGDSFHDLHPRDVEGDGISCDVNLNAMLEDLNKNMTLQGASVVSRGHCAGCAKLIVGQVITALGQLWHPEHFVCARCKEEIGTQNFFERDGLPYCEHDYHILFSPQCAYCNGPILDKCVTALDKTWHPEHFVCYSCGKELGDEGFHEKDGLVFCKDDYFQHFAPKCGMCAKPIVENFITALNQQWHPKCFACFDCHKPFGPSSFFEHEGFPYCETHFHAKRGSLCAFCSKPITGRCITAMFRKFHPDHFLCTYCQKQLTKGTFKEDSDRPYCHPCFNKLFC